MVKILIYPLDLAVNVKEVLFCKSFVKVGTHLRVKHSRAGEISQRNLSIPKNISSE
jgi:hypothetical protein